MAEDHPCLGPHFLVDFPIHTLEHAGVGRGETGSYQDLCMGKKRSWYSLKKEKKKLISIYLSRLTFFYISFWALLYPKLEELYKRWTKWAHPKARGPHPHPLILSRWVLCIPNVWTKILWYLEKITSVSIISWYLNMKNNISQYHLRIIY